MRFKGFKKATHRLSRNKAYLFLGVCVIFSDFFYFITGIFEHDNMLVK